MNLILAYVFILAAVDRSLAERDRDYQEPYFYRPWGLNSLPLCGMECLMMGTRAAKAVCPNHTDIKCICEKSPFKSIVLPCFNLECHKHDDGPSDYPLYDNIAC